MKLTHEIDNYFYAKSVKDTVMVYLMILFVIGFVVFIFYCLLCKNIRTLN